MSLVGDLSCLDETSSARKAKAVRFSVNYDLKSLILDFVNAKDQHYEELVDRIRKLGQEIRDDELLQLLKEARGCVSILDRNIKLFVSVILVLRWAHRSSDVVSEYQGFLLDLCTAHNYYTKQVIEHLLSAFKFVEPDCSWDQDSPPAIQQNCYNNLHLVLKSLLKVIPMCRDIVENSIRKSWPYCKKPHLEHISYIYNVLTITSYEPDLRLEIMKIVAHKLVSLDVLCPKEEDEPMEQEMFVLDGVPGASLTLSPLDDSKTLLNTLDHSLCIFFNFLHCQSHDASGNLDLYQAKLLFSQIIRVFEEVLLPTHASHYTQFFLFYYISLKNAFCLHFLQYLWGKVVNPYFAPVIRQAAVSYLASLVSRAKFINVGLVRNILTEMTEWIHAYIKNQESVSVVNQDTRIHGVFYATCQAVFYIIAFRYKELVSNNSGLVMLSSLGLPKMVTCRLNPLRACLPVVVSRFAAVARAYQLAYCYSVMERNARSSLPQIRSSYTGQDELMQSQLDTYFPFDPCLLPRLKTKLTSIYREYKEEERNYLKDINEVKEKRSRPDDDDDFLESSPSTSRQVCHNFSYGSSPGFLHIT